MVLRLQELELVLDPVAGFGHGEFEAWLAGLVGCLDGGGGGEKPLQAPVRPSPPNHPRRLWGKEGCPPPRPVLKSWGSNTTPPFPSLPPLPSRRGWDSPGAALGDTWQGPSRAAGTKAAAASAAAAAGPPGRLLFPVRRRPGFPPVGGGGRRGAVAAPGHPTAPARPCGAASRAPRPQQGPRARPGREGGRERLLRGSFPFRRRRVGVGMTPPRAASERGSRRAGGGTPCLQGRADEAGAAPGEARVQPPKLQTGEGGGKAGRARERKSRDGRQAPPPANRRRRGPRGGRAARPLIGSPGGDVTAPPGGRSREKEKSLSGRRRRRFLPSLLPLRTPPTSPPSLPLSSGRRVLHRREGSSRHVFWPGGAFCNASPAREARPGAQVASAGLEPVGWVRVGGSAPAPLDGRQAAVRSWERRALLRPLPPTCGPC